MLGDDGRPVFVIDTNVLVDYPDIIPSKDGTVRVFENPAVDLNRAHLVIPSAVIRELSSFKKENSERGKTARTVLRDIRGYAENNIRGMHAAYQLDAAVELPDGKLLSVLPVHADFKGNLPFRPAEDDMDGQIILAALAVAYLQYHKNSERLFDLRETRTSPVDWSSKETHFSAFSRDVVLLTNDNGLAIRARERGITTSRYSYDLPSPYTGRRDLIVPPEVFVEFWNERRLDRDIWEEFMPNEAPLVANEFVAMQLANPNDYPEEFITGDPYYRHIGRYNTEEDAIVGLRYAQGAPFTILNDGQAMYAEALLDPEISAVICTGPAGSGKTYLPTVYGMTACQKGKYIDVAVVPCANFGNLGALPGGLNEKMALDVGPIRNALRNYLLKEDLHFRKELEKVRKNGVTLRYNEATEDDCQPMSFNDKIQARIGLLWQMFFRNIPVEKARGLDFAYELALYDEFQDQSPSQADMLIKRIGHDGKIVITGDVKQIHAPYLDKFNNGIVYASRELYDSPLVARVSLLKNEVERHELVRMIAARQAKRHKNL
ncbi:PhoH family protein [Candidatus Saccharibacteria bacterium]|nr:PhoH family protein [Candidatus Saccharibacteria bacterium]